MKKVRIEVIMEYDENNKEACEFIETFNNLEIDESYEPVSDGVAVRSSVVVEL